MLFAFYRNPSSAESPHRLSGAQIRTQFTGKVLTDGTNWHETYAPGGKLLVEEIGHRASTGAWHTDGDRLCKVRPGTPNDCYEIWSSGDPIELRLGEAPPLEVVL